MAVILEERFRAVPETAPAARRAVRDVLTSRERGSDLDAAIALAVTEAVTNAILHAYPSDPSGAVALTVSEKPPRSSSSPSKTPASASTLRSPAGLGVGLRLIGHLTADHTITSSPEQGTTIAMNFRATPRLGIVTDADSHADGL